MRRGYLLRLLAPGATKSQSMSAFGNHFVPTPSVQAGVFNPLPGSDYPSEEEDLHQQNTPVGPDPPRRNFQFKSANAFLTYPRCLLTPFEAGQHLWEVARHWTPSYVLASSESHQDGTPHLHVLLQTMRPMSTRDPGFFDIQGYHPNIQASRSPNKTREYILKSPITVYSRGTFIPRAGTSGAGYGSTPVPKRNEIMRGIIETTTNKAEYLSEVQKAFPFEWATKLQQFEYSAERLFPTLPSPFVPPHPPSEPDLHCYETIRSWKDENIFQVHPYIYMLEHPHCQSVEQAAESLKRIDVCPRGLLRHAPQDQGASTSLGLHARARLPGPEASTQ